MKLANLFKKSTATEALELNAVLDTILRLETKTGAAKQAVEQAQQELQETQADALDRAEDADISPQVNAVVGERAKLEGLEGLLKQARSRAIGHIAGGSGDQRQRLVEVENELPQVLAAIDTRRVKSIAEFARKHNFRIDWPSKDNAGTIHLPAMSIEGDELRKIADATVTTVFVDEDGDKLEKLRAERQRLNVLIGSPPDLALDTLLAERRRK